MSRPPRAADRMARWLLDRHLADRLIADLHEEYERFVVPGTGPIGRRIWYWAQVIGSIRVLRRTNVRGRGTRASWLDSVSQDLRYAVRQLVRAPTFTLAAVVTLALGIGGTTAVFSVVEAVLLRSLPYDSPDRIVRAWAHSEDGDIRDFSFRVAEYRALVALAEGFDAVGAEFPVSLTVVTQAGRPHQVQGRMITSDFFEVFGVAAAQGRVFDRREIDTGDARLAVVSHDFWSRRLGSAREGVGSLLEIDGRPFRLVGVLPEDYRHVSGSDAHVFIPYTLGTSGWIGHWLDLYLRLEPGVTRERASELLNGVLERVGETDRRSQGWQATVQGLHEMVVGDVRPLLWSTFAMVALVLLIASVNVSNLGLARGTVRRSEIAVRMALGAGRARVTRQLLMEHLVLAVWGGVAGLAVAVLCLELLVGSAPAWIPRVREAGLSPTVLLFSSGATIAAVLIFGLVPALRGAQPGHALRSGGASRGASAGGSRALGALVVAEVALTSVLLVGAGLMVRTLGELVREDLGFDRAQALTFRVAVPSARYPTAADTETYYRSLRNRLLELPGVVAVGGATDLPLSGQGAVATVTSEDWVREGRLQGTTALQRRATVGFFEALGIDVLDGRGFDSTDRAGSVPSVILSESLAGRLFSDGRAVGRRVAFGSDPETEDWMTVVGVVRDVRYQGVDREPDPQIYQAHPQSASRQMAVVVRTTGEPLALVERVRAVVRELDPRVPVYAVGTAAGLVGRALAGRRFTMALFAAFAGVALTLTLAGIYGVLSFGVSARRREIGVRRALGARGADLARMILGRGAGLVIVGLALGSAAAWATARLLNGLLYGVSTFDGITFLGVGVTVMLTGLLASWMPARNALRVDPVAVLREE